MAQGKHLHVLGRQVDAGEMHGHEPVAGGLAAMQGRTHRLLHAGAVGDALDERGEVWASFSGLQLYSDLAAVAVSKPITSGCLVQTRWYIRC